MSLSYREYLYFMCVHLSMFLDLRKHDVAFLLTVRPVNRIGTRYNPNEPFVPQVGLVYVRGCEIEGMLDEAGKVIEEGLILVCCYALAEVSADLAQLCRMFYALENLANYAQNLLNFSLQPLALC